MLQGQRAHVWRNRPVGSDIFIWGRIKRAGAPRRVMVCTCGRALGGQVMLPRAGVPFPGEKKRRMSRRLCRSKHVLRFSAWSVPQSHSHKLSLPGWLRVCDDRGCLCFKEQNTERAQGPLQRHGSVRPACALEIAQCLTIGWTPPLPDYPT